MHVAVGRTRKQGESIHEPTLPHIHRASHGEQRHRHGYVGGAILDLRVEIRRERDFVRRGVDVPHVVGSEQCKLLFHVCPDVVKCDEWPCELAAVPDAL